MIAVGWVERKRNPSPTANGMGFARLNPSYVSGGRAGGRTGQACPGPRSGDRRRQHRPRLQFRRGEADRPASQDSFRSIRSWHKPDSVRSRRRGRVSRYGPRACGHRRGGPRRRVGSLCCRAGRRNCCHLHRDRNKGRLRRGARRCSSAEAANRTELPARSKHRRHLRSRQTCPGHYGSAEKEP